MKWQGYAIVAANYVLVAGIVCAAQHAAHFEHTSLALILAGATSIYSGVYCMLRDSPNTSISQVSLTLGIFLALISAPTILGFHYLFNWFDSLPMLMPITAVGNFIGPFVMARRAWTLMEQAQSGNQDVKENSEVDL